MAPSRFLPPLLVALAAWACVPELPPRSDFPGSDAGPAKADGGSLHDAGQTDAGFPVDSGQIEDGGEFDAGQVDAGQPDAGRPDGGRHPDAGQPFDAGPRDAGESDAGQPDAGRMNDGGEPIGGGCSSNADCKSNVCVTSGVPGGYCTQNCSNSNCPAGSNCQTIAGMNYCLQDCVANSQCRQGYVCQNLEGACDLPCTTNAECGNGNNCNTATGQCVVTCNNNSDCPAGQACDQGSSTCSPRSTGCVSNSDCPASYTCQSAKCVAPSATCAPDGGCPQGTTCNTVTNFCGGQVGDQCAQDSDCTAGTAPYCLTAADGFPNGFCTANCNNIGGQNGCPSGYHCIVGIIFNNSCQLMCASECTGPQDCRNDYQCVPVHSGDVCIPPCSNDITCGLNQTCNLGGGVCAGGGVPNGLNDAGM